jgi:GNAT superfamily N-acetyltransferase
VRIVPLTVEQLPEARALLEAALPRDRVALVAEEKLFGSSPRASTTLGAFDGELLLAVMAVAGRWVRLLAVDERARGRGVGSALVERAGELARASGRPLRLCDEPGNYLSPGLDRGYTEARAFFERRGFRVAGEVENLRASVAANPLISEARAAELRQRAARHGYEVRRAAEHERVQLSEWIARAFAPVWAFEVGRALDGPRRAVHVAWHDGVPVAFAAADGNNRGLGWFGPAGTDPAHRGRGLGEALLIACLLDVRELPEGGVIAWIGPKEFYRKACGAVDDRRFVQLEQSPRP